MRIFSGEKVSQKRLKKRGVAEERMTYFGRGEMDPLMDNDTEENRAKNRRVEINFVSEE